ncbi:hypothetical protein ACH6CV_05045 [Bacillota bacterium Meth-B3]
MERFARIRHAKKYRLSRTEDVADDVARGGLALRSRNLAMLTIA